MCKERKVNKMKSFSHTCLKTDIHPIDARPVVNNSRRKLRTPKP